MLAGHRSAQRHLAGGLSLGARLLLAVACGGFAVALALAAPTLPKPGWIYAFAGFCALISVAALAPPGVARPAGRLIGAAVFACALAYLVDQALGGPWFSRRSAPSLLNAILAFLAFGVPGLAYALFGRIRSPEPDAMPPEHPIEPPDEAD
jgi:hypothetical protein